MQNDIDTRQKVFTIAVAPVPRVNPENGVQRLDSKAKLPQWLVEVFVRDPSGAYKDTIIIPAKKAPDVEPGEEVILKGLYAYEWTAGKGRGGINYHADSIEPVYED